MPPAAVTHPPGPGPRAGSRAPHPAPHAHPDAPRVGPLASSPPRDGASQAPAAFATQQSGLVSAWPPRRRGQSIPACSPRSGPRHSMAGFVGPSPAPAAPNAHRGHGAMSAPGCPLCGAGCQSGSSFAACRGGSPGSGDPGSPSEAVGSSPGDKRPPPDPQHFLRRPVLPPAWFPTGARTGRARGPAELPLRPRSLHGDRHEAAASLQP